MTLTIRTEQLAVFAEVETKKFVDRMVIHLKKFFPEQCEVMDESQMGETIRYGIKRAAAYGITIKRDVSKYVDVMVVFGRDFDRDPGLPWARTILADAAADPTVKVNRLYVTATDELEKGEITLERAA
jgi:hypothetical protein